MSEKNGLPFGIRFLKGILGVLCTIALLALILYGCLYFIFKIDAFAVMNELKILNQPVDESAIVINPYSTTDLDSAKEKTELKSLMQEEISFTDKEFAAFVNDKIQDDSSNFTFSVDSTSLNLSDYNVEVKQIQFNLDDEKDTVLTTFNTVIKMNLSKLKSDKFSSFPYSIIGNSIPDDIYISATCKLKNQPGNNYEYTVEPYSLNINNLTFAETKDLFNTLNKLVSFGETNDFCTAICSSFINALIGNDTNEGIYYSLKNLDSIYHAQSYSFKNIDNNNCFVIETTYFEPDYYITYKNVDGLTNNNYIGYKKTDTEPITLNAVSKNGYEFQGWFTLDNGLGIKVTSIDPAIKTDITLYAYFTLKTYTITYNLKGGTFSSLAPTEYTIETETFTLPTPSKDDDEFEGWMGTNLTTKTKTVTITKGTFGNLEFTARYVNDEKIASIYVDGALLTTQTVESYTSFTIDNTFNLDDYNLYGYSIQNWYKDSDYTQSFTTIDNVKSDFAVYGKTKYIVEDIDFYSYITEFNNAVTNNAITINDRAKFTAWINYINFYHIDSQNIKIDLTYCANNDEKFSEFTEAFNDFKNSSTALLRINIVTNRPSILSGYLYFRFEGDDWLNYETVYASETLQAPEGSESQYILEQDAYGNAMVEPKTRTSSYEFYIEKVQKTISGIKNTEQLLYALEHGYKPICIANSNADKMYKKAKEILLNICDDSMTNVQKLQAIYEYLALNVSYDYYAAEYHNNNPTVSMDRYDSWAVEGVLNNHKAVCEGYAKTLLLMAKIENIPTIVITSDTHEWDKVYINGNWYGIDATHADSKLNCGTNSDPVYVEMFTYEQFLFTDNFKTNVKNYTAKNYTDSKYSANTKFNIYSETTINGSNLFLSSSDSKEVNQAKFNTIINNTSSYLSASSKYYTIEIAIEKDSETANISEFVNSYNSSISKKVTLTNTYITSENTNGDTTYILFIKTKN